VLSSVASTRSSAQSELPSPAPAKKEEAKELAKEPECAELKLDHVVGPSGQSKGVYVCFSCIGGS